MYVDDKLEDPEHRDRTGASKLPWYARVLATYVLLYLFGVGGFWLWAWIIFVALCPPLGRSFAAKSIRDKLFRLSAEQRFVTIQAHFARRAEEAPIEAQKQMRRTIWTVAAAVIGVIALATNPNEASLREWCLTAGGTKHFGSAGSALLDAALETHSSNYYLFSIGSARASVNDDKFSGTFLGIFGHWYPFSEDEAKPK
jgi:hypothetical protein